MTVAGAVTEGINQATRFAYGASAYSTLVCQISGRKKRVGYCGKNLEKIPIIVLSSEIGVDAVLELPLLTVTGYVAKAADFGRTCIKK